MVKLKYRWKELDLVSITTVSNIITFIQFAIIPLDVVNSETETESGMNKIEKFITLNFGSFAKVFTAPFDFIRTYEKIGAPIRVALSATAVFGVITYLYSLFFLQSWRLLLFFADLFIPGATLIGILFISRKYEEQRSNAIALMIIGIIYLIFRVVIIFIIPLFRWSKRKWYQEVASTISSIFLARLRKETPSYKCDEKTEEIRDIIERHEHSIRFDRHHYKFKNRIIDFFIVLFYFIVLLIFTIVGWKRILKDKFNGSQLKDLSNICNIITYILFGGMIIRIILNSLWLIRTKDKKKNKNSNEKIFLLDKFCNNTVRKSGYKAVYLVTGIVLLPILKMVLSASATTDITCGWYQYYDFRSNTESFLQYFMERDGMGCIQCSKTSANFVYPCNQTCYYDPNQHPLNYRVLIDSKQISETELTDVYLIPTVLLEIFYLAVFFLLFRQIYDTILNVLILLPSPTKIIDCKFQTLVHHLKSPGVGTFLSYRFKSALYYFDFTQSKLFVLFLTSLVTVIPIKVIQTNSQRIIPWIFFLACIIIASSSIFSSPYVSRLHNIVNIVSYFVGGISALLVGFHVCEIFTLPTWIGNLLMVVIILAPVLTTLITPFFVKRDHSVTQTEFDLFKLQRKDKRLDKTIRKHLNEGQKTNRILDGCRNIDDDDDDSDQSIDEDSSAAGFKFCKKVDDSDSIVDIEDNQVDDFIEEEKAVSRCCGCCKKKKENKNNENKSIPDFNLIKLAPIYMFEGFKKVCGKNNDNNNNNNTYDYVDDSKNEWSRVEVFENDFIAAKKEMFASSNKLIDCIAFNNVMRLLNLSVIISSACLGWCIGSGIVQWQRVLGPNGSDYYLRCNMFPNGTYPAFGTY